MLFTRMKISSVISGRQKHTSQKLTAWPPDAFGDRGRRSLALRTRGDGLMIHLSLSIIPTIGYSALLGNRKLGSH